jgi:hypothetical protein
MIEPGLASTEVRRRSPVCHYSDEAGLHALYLRCQATRDRLENVPLLVQGYISGLRSELMLPFLPDIAAAVLNPNPVSRINRDNRKRYDVLFVPELQDTQRRYLQRSGIFSCG